MPMEGDYAYFPRGEWMFSIFFRAHIPRAVASNDLIFASDKVYCDYYDCPDNYKLVDDADDIMCKDKKCTKDKCCKKGEVSSPAYCYAYVAVSGT